MINKNSGKEKIVKGHIEGYWEQGWEGRIEYGFVPEEGSEIKESIIFLTKGQHLTIYSKEEKVLWSGEVELVRKSWWESLRTLNVWSESKQKGVSYKQWMEWFWQEAPLKAELMIKKS